MTYDVRDETPTMTIDGRRAVVTNGVVEWMFRCPYCRRVAWVASWRGSVTVGLRGSGNAARWYQLEQTGPKPVPARCPHCGQERAYKGTPEREARGVVAGPKTLELLNHAWRHFRATLPAAETAAADAADDRGRR
jgi:DNA-directed RNA polymerase subunit RPC12/RpoP